MRPCFFPSGEPWAPPACPYTCCARCWPTATASTRTGHAERLAHPPGGWLHYITNKTIVGGFLGGLVGVGLTKKRLNVTASSGDLMVSPLLPGLRSGWLGCFFSALENGTYGTAPVLLWASTSAMASSATPPGSTKSSFWRRWRCYCGCWNGAGVWPMAGGFSYF
ncbi:hypothetical protein GCM10022407_07170 [Hymenobacter antarcticus]|uniref:Uncharacterized protein n=1 Tax=Hymenobacter antarcticus TaxID=486270 RepID=A0ABP7PBQ4_9BACT